MEILQVVAFCMVALMLLTLLRRERPEFAVQLSLVAGLAVFLLLLPQIDGVIRMLREIATSARLDSTYVITVMKIIGIAYIAEFGAQVCKDAGETSMASRVEFAGKVLILVVAFPILSAVLETIVRLLS